MSSEMTPFEALKERMTRHLAKMRHCVDVELNRLRSEAIATSAQTNSRNIFPKLAAVERSAEAAVEDVLTEGKELVDAARQQGKNAPDLWREATAETARSVLIAHVEALYALDWRMDPRLLPSVTPAIQDARRHSLAWVNGQVEDFERDVWRPKPKPATGGTTVTNNSVHISGNNSGVIQQAGAHAQQQAGTGPNAAAISQALNAVVAALSSAQFSSDTTAEISAEIATIRAQLTKPKPNFDIIRIATGAIGGVASGVGANLLTPYITALMAAVGMS